jgi:hypothetical protein
MFVADLTTDEDFDTANQPDQWIQHDFKGYSLRSHKSGPGGSHPRNWVIEGSHEGNRWTLFDRQENNSDLNGGLKTATFTLSQSEEVRFLRVRQTGPNHNNRHYLQMSALEFFGLLRELLSKQAWKLLLVGHVPGLDNSADLIICPCSLSHETVGNIHCDSLGDCLVER